MNNKLKYLNTIEYNYNEIFKNERLALESVELGYGDATLIDVAILEVLDNVAPISNCELWSGAPKIKDHIDRVLSEGLASGSQEAEDIFSEGFRLYYDDLIRDNISIIAANYMTRFINSELSKMDRSEFNSVDIKYLEGEMIHISKHEDVSGKTYAHLKDRALEIIEESKL